ncbi:hypothetical protein RJT34_18943 [Clitoria ternatea]|uniref:PGG domain-containing protein n=1 Tax=Clitoria ternatea TaxID=43366 RepID=A0AAN9IQB6_CLITE
MPSSHRPKKKVLHEFSRQLVEISFLEFSDVFVNAEYYALELINFVDYIDDQYLMNFKDQHNTTQNYLLRVPIYSYVMEILADPQPHDDAVRELYEASISGCVGTLNTLIQRDPLILSRVSLYPFTETPLHIASLLGHVEFCHVLLGKNPGLAREVNSEGRCSLHLASAEGHTEIVKALLVTKPEMSLVGDKDDMLPLHFAAMRGRIGTIMEFIKAMPNSIREMTETCDGSVLHLCVRYNHLEALKLLVESLKGDHQLLLSKDKEHNNILHLAVKFKQVKTVKYLLSLPGMSEAVNNLNRVDLTAKDMLTRYPRDFTSLTIEHILTEGVQKCTNKAVAQEQVFSPTLASKQLTILSPCRQQLTPSQSTAIEFVQQEAPSPTNDPPQASTPLLSNGPQHEQLSIPSNDPEQPPPPVSPNNDPPQPTFPSAHNSSLIQQTASPLLPNNDPPQPIPSCNSFHIRQIAPPLSSNNDPPQPAPILPRSNSHIQHIALPLLPNNDPPQSMPSSPNNGSHIQQTAPPLFPQPTLLSSSNSSHIQQTTQPLSPNNDPPQPIPYSPSNSSHTQPTAPPPMLPNNYPPQPIPPSPINSFHIQQTIPTTQSNGPLQRVTSSNITNNEQSRWDRFESFCRTYLLEQSNWIDKKTREQLMVAATVIATMTFQSVISPPGGVWQADTTDGGLACPDYGFCEAGTAVVGYVWSPDFMKFILFNSASFFSSLCVVLVLISGFPLDNKVIMWVLAVLMVAAASCMLFTYMWALGLVSPNHIYYRIRKLGYILVGTWILLLVIVFFIQITRIVFWARSRRRASRNAPLNHNSSGRFNT